MPKSLTKSDLSSIAFTTASSMILMRSSRPSGSKPHDSTAKREQNPHYGHYNGLSCFRTFCGRTSLGRLARRMGIPSLRRSRLAHPVRAVHLPRRLVLDGHKEDVMKLYFAPGASSLSPHIVLREARAKFDLEQVDLREKKTKKGDDYWKIN